MKKNWKQSILCLAVVLTLTGCNAKPEEKAETSDAETTTEATLVNPFSWQDVALSDVITLEQYQDLAFEITPYVIEEDDIDLYLDKMLENYASPEPITDRDVVENGDVANIDYEGKKDGVAFEGGTAQGYDLTIGSGSFIPGFEEGLVGVKVGETVDLPLTFPENYHSEDLAGAEVVFTVTVNSIGQMVNPELNDEFVTTLGIDDVTTEEQLRQFLEENIKESMEQANADQEKNMVIDKLMELAVIENMPEDLITRYYNRIENSLVNQAAAYGMELEAFIENYFGMTTDQYQTELQESANLAAKQMLICKYIAENENIEINDTEVDTKVETLYQDYGFETPDDFKNANDMEEFKDSLLTDKVFDYVREHCQIQHTEGISYVKEMMGL